MKFDDLYNKVFIKEQDDVSKTEVADPNDFNDIEPLPVTAPSPETPEEGVPPIVDNAVEQTSTNLGQYIGQLEDFANQLNGTDGASLNSLVSKLDRVETPFEGIYSRTSADIVDAAKTLRSVAEKLKNFIIHAAKNKG